MNNNDTGFLVAQEVNSILSSIKTLKNNAGLVMQSDIQQAVDELTELSDMLAVEHKKTLEQVPF